MTKSLPYIILLLLLFFNLSVSAQVTDIDGNVYQTVTIGTQVWMKENLKTTKYNDGTSMPNITVDATWAAANIGAYSDYGNTPANSTTYGRLYNWYAVDNNAATKVASNGGKNVCPTGWHIPSDDEWTILTTFLGAEAVAGGKLKETGTTHWVSPNTGATNETGFTALPGGYRSNGGTYAWVGNYGYWWSSKEGSATDAWYMVMYYSNANLVKANDLSSKRYGISVRCVRDAVAGLLSITSIAPFSGPVGTSVTITGTGYSTTLADNIVWFGAAKATVTAASATQLTVTVPSGSTYQPITVTVNGLTTYSAKPFNVTFSSEQVINATSFALKTDFATGSSPIYVAVADFDSDGKPDIATSNQFSNSISVFRNTCTSGAINSSSFSSKVDFTTGTAPVGIDVGDLDGDGKPDLVTANNTSGSVSVFRNTSTSGAITSSSFSTKIDFTCGVNPSGMAIGEIDGDGKPDIVVVNTGNNTVSVFRNTSVTATITAISFAAKVDFAVGNAPQNVRIQDLDGDGKSEIIATNYSSNNISILKNISTSGTIDAGSFATKVDFTTGTGPYNLAVGDIDGDDKPDVVVTEYINNKVTVFRNTTSIGVINSGALTSVSFTSDRGEGVALGDLDGDGKADIAATNYNGTVVSLLKNNSTSGSVNLASKIDFATGTMPQGVGICDFDGDGKTDIVVANSSSSVNTISVFRNIMTAASPPSAPVVGIITQPTCTILTGSVVLSGLPSTGTWTLTRSPGGVTTQGTGTSTTISGLAPGTYTYTVTNAGGGTSEPTANIVINIPAETPSTPTQGTIVQPTCKTPTGSIDIGGLPSAGTWTLTITPGGTSTGTGTHAPVAGLSPGTYSFTVTNAAGCTSTPLENIVIQAVPVGNIPVIELKWRSVLICYNLNSVFASWHWYKDNNPVGSPTDKAYFNTNKTAGMYKVLTLDKDGCKNFSNTIQVNPGSKGISAYPNPSDANVTISMADDSRGKVFISFYNQTGTKVLELQTVKSEDTLIREIPVNGIEQGIYLVKVTVDQKEVYFTRIVVAR